MELKCTTTIHHKIRIEVLIAPLWNWNGVLDCPQHRSRKVLIAPLWNWNLGKSCNIRLLISSNRTFMELKYEQVIITSQKRFVLIAPLWNWNNLNGDTWLKVSPSSNRTFMELKYLCWKQKILKNRSSNRTFMELKCGYVAYVAKHG